MGRLSRVVKNVMKQAREKKEKQKRAGEIVTPGKGSPVITKPTTRDSESDFGGTDVREGLTKHDVLIRNMIARFKKKRAATQIAQAALRRADECLARCRSKIPQRSDEDKSVERWVTTIRSLAAYRKP